jgi:SecD/SecF fusion protein
VVAEADWPRVDSLLELEPVKRLLPRGVELKWSADAVGPPKSRYRYLYALEDRPIITGSSLIDARAQLDPITAAAEVVFELDRPGGRTFGQETAKHVNDYMAILLDGKVQGRPPVIQTRIERSGRITLSGRPLVEAQDLALTLRAGSLPTPLKLVEQQTVGPTLGSDSIRGGVLAGLIGTASVILIMVGYYGRSGALAIGALALYTLYTLGGLALFDAALTLPGLAGFVLSIGIAVDANVLIFERLREELGAGKTVRLAIRAGFKNAMPAIIDSNLTTVLTALFLFRFGTEPVKGFAVTLIIGIFASMITAVFVTHTLYLLWLARRPNMASLSVGTLRFFKDASIDFIRIRRLGYGVTCAVLAAGVLFLGIRHGPDYSVEFTGGTMVRIETSAAVTEGTLRDGLAAQGIRGAEIQRIGNGSEFLIRAGLGSEGGALETAQADASVLSGTLDRVLGGDGYTLVRTEAVGPKVSGELRTQAALAIFLSFFAVLAYLAVRFEWRFGLAAVLATAHDILATIAFIAVMDLEISLVIVAAILTVLGYSLNDTIVIFDRVRENLRSSRREDFAGSLNRSINETLPRTVLTGGTALTTLVALAVFGGDVIQPFALVMFFGIFLGTFSSIFIASPVLLAIERRWPGTAVQGVRRPASWAGDAPSPG